MNNYNYALNQLITSAGSLGIGNVSNESKVRFIITNAGSNNSIRVRARLNNSTTWTVLVDLVGNVNQVIDVYTWDQLEVICTVYETTGAGVLIVANSFDETGGGSGSVTSVNGQQGDVVLTATSVGADPAGTAQTLFNTIGNKYVRTTRFAIISSGSSGTITIPANSEVVLDDFGGTVDAVVSQVSGGKPTLQSAKTASQTVVATSFDTSGNWVFTGTPSSYPVAILYRVRQTMTNFDSTSADIFGNSTVEQITKTDLNLGNVDNTSDLNKPISTATQTALDNKANLTNVQVFLSSGTWTKPAGARYIEMFCMAGGGGGGSGANVASGTAAAGGGGGAPGGVSFRAFDAASLPATLTVTVGAFGTGGATKTTDGAGNAGTAGGISSVGNNSEGLCVRAVQGGAGGAGATPGNTAAGAAGFGTMGITAAGVGATAGAAGTASSASTIGGAATSGASGGGISTTPAAFAGGTGNLNPHIGGSNVAGGAINSNGTNVTIPILGYTTGQAGGGGGSSITGNGGNAGTGLGYGFGGSGGGACLNTFSSGAGANGGPGVIIITTYF